MHLRHAIWQRRLISHVVKFDEFSKEWWKVCGKRVGEKIS